MQMEDKQDITIQLADLPRMGLSVIRSEEEFARRSEKLVNGLWALWRKRMQNETPYQAMARVAFSVAQLYMKSEASQAARQQQLEELNDSLAELLKNLPGLD